ncbi:ATP-binding cassette domain-containing protein [Pseudoalteromonas luteoviolacea]|nr:ATP-binding cassette domain-containing protein [Pseudoalteromonas luteoviolacea]
MQSKICTEYLNGDIAGGCVMKVIQVECVSKTYQYFKKPQGFSASLKQLFHREVEYKEAIKDMSFDIERGQVVAVVGENGAGKTTTMKMLSGILHPTRGHIKIFGSTPCAQTATFKKRCSFLTGQSYQLWPDLPAIDSFNLCQCIYEIPLPIYRQRLSYLTEFFRVSHLLDIQVRRLSGAERLKMELIAALLHGPDLLFLDELTLGLDYLSQREVMRCLKQLAKEDKLTVLVSSDTVDDISTLCERVLVIKDGRLIYDNDIELAKQVLEHAIEVA